MGIERIAGGYLIAALANPAAYGRLFHALVVEWGMVIWLRNHVHIFYAKPSAWELSVALVILAFGLASIWREKRRNKRD